jgi:hypothetical protein
MVKVFLGRRFWIAVENEIVKVVHGLVIEDTKLGQGRMLQEALKTIPELMDELERKCGELQKIPLLPNKYKNPTLLGFFFQIVRNSTMSHLYMGLNLNCIMKKTYCSFICSVLFSSWC